MRKNLNNTDGLTVVELIVVIAVVGIIAGITLPIISGVLNTAETTSSSHSETERISFNHSWTAAGASLSFDGGKTIAVIDGETVATISGDASN